MHQTSWSSSRRGVDGVCLVIFYCVKPSASNTAITDLRSHSSPPETVRNQTKPVAERTKVSDATVLEQRRPGLDRTTSRNNASTSQYTLQLLQHLLKANTFIDPDDIILGPPRTSFASATTMRSNRVGEIEKPVKDAEPRDKAERFNFRNKTSDADNGSDRFKESRTNTAFRRRGDADQDSEGWSTVKPRKSFGTEGAERFHGRMGGPDRTAGRDDKRFRDREVAENGDRRTRNTEPNPREKDSEDADASRWNGLSRNRAEPRVKENSEGAPSTQRERIDRAKSWRDRHPEEKPVEKHVDRPNDRAYDRRWDRDRDHRVEREPEWMDEPAEEKSQGKTGDDLKKWMESMKASTAGAQKTNEGAAVLKPAAKVVEIEHKVVSTQAVESGPDKFFATYGAGANLDISSPAAEAKDSARPKTGKSSRFTSFFSSQDDSRGRAEPPTPAAVAPPSNALKFFPPQQNNADKAEFAKLLQKLQRQSMGQGSQPPPAQPTPSFPEHSSTPAGTPGLAPRLTSSGSQPGMQHGKNAIASPDMFQQYGGERREDPRLRGPPQPHSIQDMLSSRPMPLPSQPPPPRPEQTLQDVLTQRPQGMGQGSGRLEQNAAPANNAQAEFLMRLMNSARAAPEPLRTEQLMVRMPQPTKQVHPSSIQDREPEYHRERTAPQPQRQMRPQGAPGFFDDQYQPPDNDHRPQQPTQILQRPPPPGLDHHISQYQMGGAPQMPPQRPMIPPPGINMMGNPRNGAIPGVFPPDFSRGPFPPGGLPDSMLGPQGPGPRNMPGPPGFFGGIPPPGLYMPPPNMGGFQGGPDAGPPFGAPPPFDGRNMPPHGAGGQYRRQ